MSPVPAELMLIGLVVVAGVVVYVFVSGLSGNLSKTGGAQVTTDLSLDAYSFPASGPLTFSVRNVGNSSVTLQSVYINGNPVANPGCLQAVAPRAAVQCSFTPSPLPGAGTTEQVKVITSAGGAYSFNVIVGGAS